MSLFGHFQEMVYNIHTVNPPPPPPLPPSLFIGVEIFERLWKGGSRFSLVRYGFCSSNALHSASLSFRMFIKILD